MVSNQKIDELLKSLDETIDSLESGLNCNDETRKIVRDWLVSAQLQRAPDEMVRHGVGRVVSVSEAPDLIIEDDNSSRR